MIDQFERTIDYMRVSITDRCNLRCRYCMPEGVDLVSMKELLTYEELVRIVRAAADLGIKKIKITGGEPLARLGCADLIAQLKAIPSIEQVTMTTNGVLLKKHLPELLNAGLDAVNISLDTLDAKRFQEISRRDELASVLEGLEASLAAGLRTKINVVLQKDMNEDEWFSLAGLAKEKALDVRFIEMMPIGFGKEFNGISNETLREELRKRYPDLEDDSTVHGNGPAVYVRIPGWKGSIGFISAMHGRFCDRCNRVRLTAQGRLKPCLCYGETADLLPVVRGAHPEEELKKVLEEAIYQKPKQHCFEDPEQITEKGRMASIGG